jgi:hypothetical protein
MRQAIFDANITFSPPGHSEELNLNEAIAVLIDAVIVSEFTFLDTCMTSKIEQALTADDIESVLEELPAQELTLPMDTPRIKVCALYTDSA